MKLAEWLNSLDPSVKRTIITITAIIAVLAPILTVISKITLGLGVFLLILPKIKVVLTGLMTVVTTAMGRIIGFIGNHPIATAVYALIVALTWLYNHCEAFREIVNNIIKGLVQLKDKFKADAVQLYGMAIDKLSGGMERLIGFISSVISWLGKAISKVAEFINSFSGIGGVVSGISGAFGGIFGTGGGINPVFCLIF